MNPKIISHFQKTDPTLHSVIDKIKPIAIPEKSTDYFSDLCEAIVGQQLSDKAASTIFGRFKKLFVKEKITPEQLLKIPDNKVRLCGTSNSKVHYLKNLASAVIEEKIILKKLDELENELVVRELTKIKGIGPWTAEMFLMFSLAREDVFSFGDLGLKKGIQRLYKFKKEPTRKQMEKLSKKWIPYRTYAARILWRSLEI